MYFNYVCTSTTSLEAFPLSVSFSRYLQLSIANLLYSNLLDKPVQHLFIFPTLSSVFVSHHLTSQGRQSSSQNLIVLELSPGKLVASPLIKELKVFIFSFGPEITLFLNSWRTKRTIELKINGCQ